MLQRATWNIFVYINIYAHINIFLSTFYNLAMQTRNLHDFIRRHSILMDSCRRWENSRFSRITNSPFPRSSRRKGNGTAEKRTINVTSWSILLVNSLNSTSGDGEGVQRMPIESRPGVPKAANSDARVSRSPWRSLPALYPSPLFPPPLSLSPITNDRAAPEGQRQSCRLRRTSSAVIPRPVDRPVSHGLKRSVEVLIRVSDRVPRPLITEPDLIRCPPMRRFPPSRLSRDARAMRNRSGGGGFKSPVRFKPFDERPSDNCREFAAEI